MRPTEVGWKTHFLIHQAMKFELKNLPKNSSEQDIVAEIKRVDGIVGKDILTKQDYDKLGKITSGAIQKRLGGWRKALALAGLKHKYSGRTVSSKMRQQSKALTDEEILKEMRRIAEKLGQKFVTQENVNQHSSIISASTIVYRFGSYENGIKKAGLESSPGYRGRFSKEDYFENLLNVWTYHGRQPLLREMDESPSVIASSTYESHFKTWRKALEAFVGQMNQSESPSAISKESTNTRLLNSEIASRSVTVEDRRAVPLGLRYKVLSRDRFKCIKCGESPAVNETCRLHIDHVVPFSRGGKTLLENLQTLCAECNLGKGNRSF